MSFPARLTDSLMRAHGESDCPFRSTCCSLLGAGDLTSVDHTLWFSCPPLLVFRQWREGEGGRTRQKCLFGWHPPCRAACGNTALLSCRAAACDTQPLLVLVNPAHPCSVPASGSDGFPRGSRFGCFIIPYHFPLTWPRGLPRWLSCKDSTCRAGDAGDVGLIPGSGRFPGRGNSSPLWYSCLENPMDRGAWRSIVHEVTESWMWRSNWTPFSLLIAFCQDSEGHRMWGKKHQRWHPSYWSEQLKRGLLFAELKEKLTV